MAITKILITVKTYPTLSAKYDETVCTAGVTENGNWVRIYPISFRKKDCNEQYKKYDWIELDLEKNRSDFRPESYRVVAPDSKIKIIGHIDTKNKWEERKKIVLNKVYNNLSELITEARSPNISTSLAVFKPTKILDFKCTTVDKEWKQAKLANLQAELECNNLFKVAKKLPFKFSYTFADNVGTKSTLMLEDWEIGQLYWKYFRKYKDEMLACEKVKENILTTFQKRKTYIFISVQLKNGTLEKPKIHLL